MKCTIPEISWHNREPVLSVDIHSVSSEFYKLATAGGDSHVLIWQMAIGESGAVKQEVISDLTRHQKAVNIVRWSPSGQYLASADDDANIIIWQLKTDNIPLLEGDTGDKEIWVVYKVMRGHKEDVYDLCWSPTSLKILSGSIDNTAILWDISKGKMDHILTDHKGFVQGVAWDPKNQVIASISTDRTCRLFDVSGKHVKARITKGKLPVDSNHFLCEKEVKYFYDDTFKSFFRRLQFSPDGSLVIVPSGHMEGEDCKRVLNATLLFTLDNINEPAALLPHGRQCSTVIRCCPVLFELRSDGPKSLVNLPYRMIFAVGTDHDVILYDTQQRLPFARLQEIHYTRMTDLTWSNDGLLLVASSTDGFCALITFEPNELGVPYVKEDLGEEENILDVSMTDEAIVEKDENVDINNSIADVEAKETEKKRPSFIEKWALNPPSKKIKPHPVNTENPSSDQNKASSPAHEKPTVQKIDIVKNSPRRITPICLSKKSPRRITAKTTTETVMNDSVDLTLDSPVKETVDNKTTPSTPRRIVPIPVRQTFSNKKTDNVSQKQTLSVPIETQSLQDADCKHKTPERILPLSSDTKTDQTQTTDQRISPTLDPLKSAETTKGEKKSRRITPIPVKNSKPANESNELEKMTAPISIKRKSEQSPSQRKKPIPADEKITNGKIDTKNSPKTPKVNAGKEKSLKVKKEHQKSTTKSITDFLIKGKSPNEKAEKSIGTRRITQTSLKENRNIGNELKVQDTIDLTSDD